MMRKTDELITMTPEQLRLVKNKDSLESLICFGIGMVIWFGLCLKKTNRKLKELQK